MAPVHDPRFTDSHRHGLVEASRRDAADSHKWLYIIPLIMLGAGLLAIAAILGSRAEENAPLVALLAVPLSLVALAVMSIAGLLAMIIVCAICKTDAGPVWLAFVRLMGVYAVITPIFLLLAAASCFGVIATFAILAGVIAMVFELELMEGALFVVVNIGVSFVGQLLLPAVFG